jgi:uracil-DNA glycosylase
MSQTPTLSPSSAAKALAAWWEMAGVEPIDIDAVIRAATAKSPRQEAQAPTAKPQAVRAQAASARKPVDALGDAQRLAAACTSVDALNKAIASFEGCGLKASARNCVAPDGIVGAPILIIGEAPDRDEDETGRAFSGLNGELLDKMLASIGLSRAQNCYLANLIPWRPPGDRKPTADELAICKPFITRLIELAQPKALLFLGSGPAQVLMDNQDSIMKLRTRSFRYGNEQQIYAQCLLSPAYLRNRPSEKALAWKDLLRFEAEISALGVARAN